MRPNAARFHLASEWTISTLAFGDSAVEKLTGRSVPLRLSFMPVPASTNSGADTRVRLSASDRQLSKPSFSRFMAALVSRAFIIGV